MACFLQCLCQPNRICLLLTSLSLSISRLDSYKKLEVRGSKDATLGEGAYGVVYKALDTVLDKHVALKKIRLETEEEGIPTTALREMSLLRQLDHPNVVRLENVVMEPGKLYLVFELVDTDLKKLMDSSEQPFRPDLVQVRLFSRPPPYPTAFSRPSPSPHFITYIQSYTAQLLSGIAHCHFLGVMHRDLKPQNILMSSDGVLKIADFGLSRCFTPHAKPLTIEVITRWYRAPEIMLGSNVYTCAVDLWSVGCIVAEMANKRAFLPGDSEIDQLFKIFRVMGTPSPNNWPQLSSLPYWKTTFPEWQPASLKRLVPSLGAAGTDLLERLFVYNPVDRISARDALDHAFVAPVVQRLEAARAGGPGARPRVVSPAAFGSGSSTPSKSSGTAMAVAAAGEAGGGEYVRGIERESLAAGARTGSTVYSAGTLEAVDAWAAAGRGGAKLTSLEPQPQSLLHKVSPDMSLSLAVAGGDLKGAVGAAAAVVAATVRSSSLPMSELAIPMADFTLHGAEVMSGLLNGSTSGHGGGTREKRMRRASISSVSSFDLPQPNVAVALGPPRKRSASRRGASASCEQNASATELDFGGTVLEMDMAPAVAEGGAAETKVPSVSLRRSARRS